MWWRRACIHENRSDDERFVFSYLIAFFAVSKPALMTACERTKVCARVRLSLGKLYDSAEVLKMPNEEESFGCLFTGDRCTHTQVPNHKTSSTRMC